MYRLTIYTLLFILAYVYGDDYCNIPIVLRVAIRQNHWNRVGEGEGERVWELCDSMVSVHIIINILVHNDIMIHNTNILYHYIYISQNV